MYNQLTEYIKLHIISLEQDIEKLMPFLPNEGVSNDITFIKGQIESSRHYLSVASDILTSS